MSGKLLEAALVGIGLGFGLIVGLGFVEFLRYRFRHVFQSPEELRGDRRRRRRDDRDDDGEA